MIPITIEGLHKKFGEVTALNGISLRIEKGELFFLLGPSGCGKTTLLRHIAGFYMPDSGKIFFGDEDVTHVPPHKRNTGMMFQSYALWPHMTVAKNVAFGLEERRMPSAEVKKQVAAALESVQMQQYADRKIAQLSGGQQQRVALARALVIRPRCLLLDEPLSNLDAKLRVEMRMEIKQLHQRIRSTNVYVTHDQIEAMTMATRIAVMHQGEIQQFADPDTVYNRPANLFVARFMGAPPMNTLPARIEAAAGGVRAVVGQGETAVSLPLPAAFAAQAGREVVLGLRPECIAEEDRRFGHGGERVTLELPVEMTEPTGAETIVLARLGGERALARVSPDVRLQPGDRGRFALDMRRVCLFDPGTGALIV